jgi:uncharacterized membrane protein YfcA
MGVLEAIAIFAAGVVAGTINSVVGSGTLFTFPVLLAFGYAPVVANVSNTVGLVPGNASGAVGYRRELIGQQRRAIPLMGMSLIGAAIGATLLLTLPASAFKEIVPVFIATALILIVLQPRISSWLAARGGGVAQRAGPLASAGVLAAGVYGGYFGAAQGIMVLSILSLSVHDSLHRLNALKVVLVGIANLVSGLVFVFAAHVAWAAAGLIAGGSVLGGLLGARIGRRLSPQVLRAVVVVVGIVAIVRLL